MLTQALIINLVVLLVVLESDLGPHRKVTRFRIYRPLVTALLVVPFFLKGVALSGTGLALEVILIAAGVLFGLLTATQMRVFRSPQTGRPVTRAGFPYALLWTAVVAARFAFSYGSVHWFGPSLARWMAQHHVDSSAVTAALIFMALAMLVTRVAVMGARARRITPARITPAPGQDGSQPIPARPGPEPAEHARVPATAGTRWTNLASQAAMVASDAAIYRTQTRRSGRSARRQAHRSRRA
jgi:hypothetical protein